MNDKHTYDSINQTNNINNELPLDFDWELYVKINDDISSLDEVKAKLHYVNFGRNEKRLYKLELPDDFDWEEYLLMNNDLRHLDEFRAKLHYIHDGKREKRTYKLDLPENFDWQEYIGLNQDLSNLCEIDAKYHYCAIGKKEGRIYNKGQKSEKYFVDYDEHEYKADEQEEKNTNFEITSKQKKICIILHIGYPNQSLINFYLEYLLSLIRKNRDYVFDIYLSMSQNNTISFDIAKPANLQNIGINIVENAGGDLPHYIDFILRYEKDYDFIVKLHTKTKLIWTYELLTVFNSFEYLSDIFENSNAGIIGYDKYKVHFLNSIISKEYNEKILEIYKEFELYDNVYTSNDEYNNIIMDKFEEIDLFDYYNKNDDIYNNIDDLQMAKEHMENVSKNKNETRLSLVKDMPDDYCFVAGTIFAIRGDVIKKIRNKYTDRLKKYRELILSTEKGYQNDANGTIFRYAHTMERLLQTLVTKFGYCIKGIEPDNKIITKELFYDFKMPKNITGKNNILLYSHDLTNTGAPIFLYELCKVLLRKYNDIYLLCLNGGQLETKFSEILGEDNIFILNKRENNFNNDIHIENIRITRKLIEIINPELIYVNTIADIYPIYAGYNGKRKIIVHAHEAELSIIELYNTNRIFTYDFCKYVDKVLCVNDKLAKLLSSWTKEEHLINEKYIVVNNGLYSNINLNIYDHEILDKKKKYKMVIGMVGTKCLRKGHDIFENLAKRHNDYLFIWAGSDLKSDIENLIYKNYESKDMSRFYNSIDLLMYVSRSESWSNVLYEAIYHNLKTVYFGKNVPIKMFANYDNVRLIDDYVNLEKCHNIIENIHDIFPNHNTFKNIFTNENDKFYNLILDFIIMNKKKQTTKDSKIKKCDMIDVTKNYPVYKIFENYVIINEDLNNSLKNYEEGATHYFYSGYNENRLLFRSPVRCKKTILFTLHDGNINGATKIGLLIASKLQSKFNVILLCKDDKLLKNFSFEHPTILIKNKEVHSLYGYLDRVDLAKKIIKEINPDIVYVNSSCCHEYYHASMNMNIPCIYHAHEGNFGVTSELEGRIIPYDNYFAHINHEFLAKCKFYSASFETTKVLRNRLGVNKDIYEFQPFDSKEVEKLSTINNDIISSINKDKYKKIFGMVGARSYRKGFDVFCEISSYFSDCLFIWVGAKDDISTEYKNDNLVLVGETKNPYSIMKEFDYFLFTSREDIFGLVALESIILNIPVIFINDCIGIQKELNDSGCYGFDYEHNLDSWKKIVNEVLSSEIKTVNKKIIEKYDYKNIIPKIEDDIFYLCGGFINEKLHKYYRNPKYGLTIFNYIKVNKIISAHYEKEFNEEKYISKYQDLVFAGINSKNAKLHFDHVGKYNRNCDDNDWKTYLILNEHLVREGIDSEEKLISNKISYDKIKVQFDLEKYKKKHRDICHDTDEKIIEHWKTYGSWEGRLCF